MGADLGGRRDQFRGRRRVHPLFRIAQAPLEKAIDLLIRLLGGSMAIARCHGDSIVAAQQVVDRNSVIEGGPALREIGGAAGYQKWPRRHQCVQFDQVMAAFNERFISAGAWLVRAGEIAKEPGILRIGNAAQVEPQIPDVPVINAAAGVLLTPVAFVEDDAWVRPNGAGELIVKAGGEHAPFPAKGVTNDPNSLWVDLRGLRQ